MGLLTAFVATVGLLTPPPMTQRGSGPTNPPPKSLAFVPPKNRAILIYTDEYEAPLTDLPNAKVDAESLAKVLEQGYGYETKLVPNPSLEEVKDALHSYDYLTADLVPLQDQLIVYVAGHGKYDRRDKEGYLLLKNANPKDGTDTLPVTVFFNSIAGTAIQRVLVIIDTCDAGLFVNSVHRGISVPAKEFEPYDEPSAFKVMMANYCRTGAWFIAPGDGAIPDGPSKKGSPFCQALVNILSQGKSLLYFDAADLAGMLRQRGLAEVRKDTLPLRTNEATEFSFIYKPLLDKWKGKTAGLAPDQQ